VYHITVSVKCEWFYNLDIQYH